MPIGFEQIEIKTHGIRSLCWDGDSLVDWVSGGKRFHLDGSVVPAHINYAYRFDAAVLSTSRRYAVIYERLGTKGLVLEGSKVLREINRSFYHAHVYEYPVTFFSLADGTEVLAHCPADYNRIEFDVAATGKPLTEHPDRKPADFFIPGCA